MPGFDESPAPIEAPPLQMAQVKVGPDGRILIPAELRRAAGLQPGATVLVDLRDGALEVSTFANRVRRVQAMLAPYKTPGVSIVDELIADRRAEAAAEDAEG